MSKINLFVRDSADIRYHFEVDPGTTIEDLNHMFSIQINLSKWLAEHSFVADDSYSRSTTVTAQGGQGAALPPATVRDPDAPKCGDCGSETEYKSGVAKNGKAWSGYFCLATANAAMDRRHKPVWV